MEFIIFIGGVIVGSIVTTIIKSRYRTCGIVDVDHRIESCSFRVTSDDLANRKIKKVILMKLVIYLEI